MPLQDLLPQIDDRRFDDLVAEIRTRIARYSPEWRPGESAWTDVNDEPRYFTVYDQTDTYFWGWKGEGSMRLNLVFERAGQTFVHDFVIGRMKVK